MTAEEWMQKGYSDGWRGKGPYSPPNHPVARAAYDHGWKNAEADCGIRAPHPCPSDVRERAEAIIAADKDDE